jgi:hypothetical protein
VLKELQLNLRENEQITLENKHISDFLMISNLKVMQSNVLRGDFATYVNDLQDAQILQDAFDIRADYLLTKNLRDFDITSIEAKLHIIVI